MNTCQKLVRWYFYWTWPCLAVPAAALTAYETLAVLWLTSSEQGIYLPFETILMESYADLAFFIALAGSIYWLAARFQQFYRKSPRAIYTILTLPGPRFSSPAAQSILGGLYAAMLFALQNLLAAALYPIFTHTAERSLGNFLSAAVKTGLMTAETAAAAPAAAWQNGLFLAFARCPLLRLTFPISFYGVLCMLAVILACAVAVQAGARVTALTVVFPWTFFLYRDGFLQASLEWGLRWFWVAALLFISVWTLWRCLRNYRDMNILP